MKFEAATATQEVVEILCGVSPNTFILNVMAILLFISHIYKFPYISFNPPTPPPKPGPHVFISD